MAPKGSPGGDSLKGGLGIIACCSWFLFHVSVFCVFSVFSRNTTLLTPKVPIMLSPIGAPFAANRVVFREKQSIEKRWSRSFCFTKHHPIGPRTCPQRRPKSGPRTTRKKQNGPSPRAHGKRPCARTCAREKSVPKPSQQPHKQKVSPKSGT